MVGRLNYGEAAEVGGDCLFGCFPPAGRPLPGGMHGGRTTAKPPRSEVMIFLMSSSGREPPHRKSPKKK